MVKRSTLSSAPADADASGGATSTRSEFRKAPSDVNRIPGSAASMKVLERSKVEAAPLSSFASSSKVSSSVSRLGSSASTSLRSRTAIQAMQPFLDSSTTSASPIQPTDIQLLTTSILSNQERQRVILYYQEKLIDSEPTLNDLKKSLLFLSSSSWGQILEERKLVEKCSYPPCANASPSANIKGARGKFRINLRNKSVKAVEDLDLGEAGNTYDDLRDYFCSKSCYARSEWILRWVLSDKEIGLLDSNQDAQKHGGGGGGGALGGKWQKLTNHPGGYEQVELLEDIEREQGVNLADAEDEDALQGVGADGKHSDLPSSAQKGEEGEPQKATSSSSSAAADANVCNLMGDLTIIERSKSTGSSTNTSQTIDPVVKITSSSSPPRPSVQKAGSVSRTAYTVDVPNTLGARFSTPTTTTTNTTTTGAGSGSRRNGKPNPTHGDDDHDGDDDANQPQGLEEELEERERQLSHILRFASLAAGSKPRPRNTTIRFDSSPLPPTPSSASASASTSGSAVARGAADGEEHEDGDEDGPVLDPQLVAQRNEIRRIMDLAVDVRRNQRELGLLD